MTAGGPWEVREHREDISRLNDLGRPLDRVKVPQVLADDRLADLALQRLRQRVTTLARVSVSEILQEYRDQLAVNQRSESLRHLPGRACL